MHTTSTLNMERDTPFQKRFKSIAATSKLFDKNCLFQLKNKTLQKKIYTVKHLTSTNCDKQKPY